jgi:hypothetical protein
MRLRQIALVAKELAPVKRQIFALLGIEKDYQDVGVGEFGLENSVMAIGDTYLEVVAPIKDNTAAGRLLERRSGDGGYMVIAQTDDISQDSVRIEKLGVRKIWEENLPDVKAFHMHPKDVGGAIASIDQMIPPKSWRWAGPLWQDQGAKLVDEIVGVELQSEDVKAMASRWSEVFDKPIADANNGSSIALDQGEIRFVKESNGRGSGVSGVYFRTKNLQSILKIAKAEGLEIDNNRVTVCGTNFYFVG